MQISAGALHHTSVHTQDVAVVIVYFMRPTSDVICGQFKNAMTYRRAVRDISVAREEHGRLRFISIQTDEITDFGVAEIGCEIGRSGSGGICRTPQNFWVVQSIGRNTEDFADREFRGVP